ncbi:hypothetical protein BSF44_36930 [Pseudomonas sp. ACN8]|nr:hypothetical protein BSF44_36930 [Pseudomonas sp. ACN8]
MHSTFSDRSKYGSTGPSPDHSTLTLLDTTELHAQAAVAFALGD